MESRIFCILVMIAIFLLLLWSYFSFHVGSSTGIIIEREQICKSIFARYLTCIYACHIITTLASAAVGGLYNVLMYVAVSAIVFTVAFTTSSMQPHGVVTTMSIQ